MGQRPSEIYAIEGELEQWCFDRAVQTFGSALEGKLQLIARDAKRSKEAERKIERELDKWLSSADGEGKKQGRFADPMKLHGLKKK